MLNTFEKYTFTDCAVDSVEKAKIGQNEEANEDVNW